MEGSGTWQGLILVSIVTWICVSSYLKLTHKFRSLVQPWVSRQVVGGVPLILNIQVPKAISFTNPSSRIEADFALTFEFGISKVFLVELVLQKHQNRVLDAFFSCLSCVVSVPFYTAFLPLLFWVTFKTSS